MLKHPCNGPPCQMLSNKTLANFKGIQLLMPLKACRLVWWLAGGNRTFGTWIKTFDSDCSIISRSGIAGKTLYNVFGGKLGQECLLISASALIPKTPPQAARYSAVDFARREPDLERHKPAFKAGFLS